MDQETVNSYQPGDEWSLPIIQSTTFVSIFDGMPDALVISDSSGSIKQINLATEKLFKYTRQQLLNMKIEDLIPTHLRKKHIEHRKYFIENPESRYMGMRKLSLSAIDSDGKEVYIESALFSHTSNQGPLVINIIREVSARRDEFLELSEKAFYDHLTKSANRFYLHSIVSNSLIRAKRSNAIIALLYIDIDKFKLINDTYGHTAGDKVLIEITNRLNSVKREGDVVARLGGDEFAMVLFQLTSKKVIHTITQRLFEALNEPFFIDKTNLHVSVSIGIAYNVDVDNNEKILFEKADENMYKAKCNGGNQALS